MSYQVSIEYLQRERYILSIELAHFVGSQWTYMQATSELAKATDEGKPETL